MVLKAADVNVGDTHEKVVVEDLTVTQIQMYAGASGDYNAVHTDHRYATEVAGYKSIFAHGMLTMGATGGAVTDLFGADQLGSFGGQFRSQVWPGATLTTKVTIDAVNDTDDGKVAECSVVTTDDAGAVVFQGSASARLQD